MQSAGLAEKLIELILGRQIRLLSRWSQTLDHEVVTALFQSGAVKRSRSSWGIGWDEGERKGRSTGTPANESGK